MDSIQGQIERVLREKGVTPPHMTQQQFFEEFSRRFDKEVAATLTRTANRIASDIYHDEMKQVDRNIICRYARNKSEKHCCQPPDCFSCPNYRPLPRWRRWFTSPKNMEFLVIGFAALSLIVALLSPAISYIVLGMWFATIVVSRIQIYKISKILQEMRDRSLIK